MKYLLISIAAAIFSIALSGCLQSPLSHDSVSIPPFQAESRYAYATIFYEAGANDHEYFLGARVALNSIKTHGSKHDRIVLVDKDCSPQYIQGFLDDGVKVQVLNHDIDFSFEHKARWGHVLNKLAVWNLLDYERVIYMDADVIATSNPDVLLNCGHFCIVYMNPVHFHTGLMVIKPDKQMYDQLIYGLTNHGSYDGADQGFLNAFFQEQASDSPVFDPVKKVGQSEDPINRLKIIHNMNHFYFYFSLSFASYLKAGEELVTITFPIPFQWLKPWSWVGYPLFEVNFLWLKEQRVLYPLSNYWMYAVASLLCPVWFWLSEKFFRKLSRVMPVRKGAVGFRPWLFRLCLVLILLSSFAIPMRYFIPLVCPYELAWPLVFIYASFFNWFFLQIFLLACRWPVVIFKGMYVYDFVMPITAAVFVFSLPAWVWMHGICKAAGLTVLAYDAIWRWGRLINRIAVDVEAGIRKKQESRAAITQQFRLLQKAD